MRRTGAAVALVAAAVLTGCTADGSDAEIEVLAECVQRAEPECQTLDAGQFAELVDSPGVVVLDVRTPAEFAEGHLPGAVNIDVSAPDFADRAAALDPGALYAVYCRSGNRSQVALDVMHQLGITSAAHLAGGIQAWVAAGGATE